MQAYLNWAVTAFRQWSGEPSPETHPQGKLVVRGSAGNLATSHESWKSALGYAKVSAQPQGEVPTQRVQADWFLVGCYGHVELDPLVW